MVRFPPAFLIRWRTASTIAGVISAWPGYCGGPIRRVLRSSVGGIAILAWGPKSTAAALDRPMAVHRRLLVVTGPA
jgi:hypothetical protein